MKLKSILLSVLFVLVNAALWAASKFEEWGMEVIMDEVGELPVGFNRGPWFGHLLSEDGMVLHFATPSNTSGTRGVERGHVLLEPSNQAEFDKMKGALKGAWVLIVGGHLDAFDVGTGGVDDPVRR
jgi:carboxypeptidase Q